VLGCGLEGRIRVYGNLAMTYYESISNAGLGWAGLGWAAEF
jgi:hypothetical protein